MSDIADFIQSILERNKGFMKWNELPAQDIYDSMSAEMKCQLGFSKKGRHKRITDAAIRKAIKPLIEDKFIFSKKGSTLYVLIPCDPSEFVLNALSVNEAVNPKSIAKDLPLSAADFLEIVNELAESGRIRIKLNDKFEARIMLSVQTERTGRNEYTREEFKAAFDELEHGNIFVNIPELRKKLNWPHDVFDAMIRELRDEGIIQLHVTDLTIFEPNEFFYDEDDNSRMGMVTWNDR